jgi:hypothetical protein
MANLQTVANGSVYTPADGFEFEERGHLMAHPPAPFKIVLRLERRTSRGKMVSGGINFFSAPDAKRRGRRCPHPSKLVD